MTLIVPNIIDSVKISEIFNELVTIDTDLEDDPTSSEKIDKLLNVQILRKIKEFTPILQSSLSPNTLSTSLKSRRRPYQSACPFCNKPLEALNSDDNTRNCNCNYHVVYAYRMLDDKALKLSSSLENNSSQPFMSLHLF